MKNTEPRLSARGLTKRFGGLVAVKSFDFDLYPGEILGLIGPNGSGKSTVMKLVMGLEKANAGSVRLDGVELVGKTSYQIARAGCAIVFQHSRPLPLQTVLEHILLGALPDRLTRFRPPGGAIEQATRAAERCGLGAVLDRRPASLPFADLRRMELAKALVRNPRVVLVDEPFAGLTSSEVAEFSKLICSFRDEGHAVLLIDHNVRSVAGMADRVIALYLGEKIAEGTAAAVTADETVRRVYLGAGLAVHARPEAEVLAAPKLLEVENLDLFYGKAQALEKVTLTVHEREFVSLIGINGAGKTSLFNAISGLVQHRGRIAWQGRDRTIETVASIARDGLVQCPETRELFGTLTVRENLDLGGQHQSKIMREERRDWLFGLFPILKSRADQAARTLSGGEQQMLAIARALMMQPKLLILDEPTLGLAPVILSQLSEALETLRATTDITVLLGEQNVTFALPHADRIYVLDHGRVTWQGPPGRFAAEAGAGFL